MMRDTPSATSTVAASSDHGDFNKEADVETVPAGRFGNRNKVEPVPAKDKTDANVSVQPAGPHKSFKHMNEIERSEYLSEKVETGEKKYHKLGWIQLVVVLIVEAIALGSLSLPK